ncbi:MAG TPA: COX15/CtaA family protein [Hyphomicrobiaceae bacterium]|nr:COX15/CtaA family protein [Hyphomicrobiaceae bacterium]
MAPGVATRPSKITTGESSALHVRCWLIFVALLVIAMVAVGGATRLTDSGLSITEWQPILGAIPPLSDSDWQTAFEKYKQIPEYLEVNKGMSLAAFKAIFWWEWAHRFLGRFIGIAFALPLLWFWLRSSIPEGYGKWFLGLLLLGALQGFVGWYMVRSGLVDRIDVSQYRLALHLCLAFAILGLLVWYIAALGRENRAIYLRNIPQASWLLALVLVGLVFAQVALGAFVAGTKAGLTYNTWPLMDGDLVPDGLFALRPWYANFAENHLTIQFNHRIMAYALIVLSVVHLIRLRSADDPHVRRSAWLLAVLIVAQAGLGIWTLLAAHGAIPVVLGVAHQTTAALVFAVAVWHCHQVMRAVAPGS